MNDLYLIEYNKIHIENPSLSAKVADNQRLFFFTANIDCVINSSLGVRGFSGQRVFWGGYVVLMSLCSQ